jgi:hypothetical protein
MKQSVTLLCIAIFALISCGPSKESESKAWQKNLDAAKSLKSTYPVYASLIDSKISEATKLWDEAAGISNEDAKLKKMVAANDLLDAGCIGNLSNMKSKISDLKLKKEGLMQLKAPDYQTESRARNAFQTVENAIDKAEKVLYLTPAEFKLEEAPGKIDIAWNGLTDAYREVEIIIDNINKDNKAVADQNAKKQQDLKDEKQKTEEAKADIKCPYCGTMNPHDYTKCKSCGAPKEK